MDFHSFYVGNEFEAYKYLGAHLDGNVCTFRTFAPQANKIELLFHGNIIPMNPVYDGNFYEAVVTNALDGDRYEYRIYGKDGSVVDHMDPYGFGTELRPDHKSIIRKLDSSLFSDVEWLKQRDSMMEGPLNIYEMHAGSWRKPWNRPDDWYHYRDLATLLIPYLKNNHYNYVEFLPLCEHPSDQSWGYQNTGYFSPTSRYGTAGELMEAINMFHMNGIGVILDFVPVHFALDKYALVKYDGTSLYEYPHDDVGVSEWGSCNFMHSRGEIRSFLQSSVNYWLKEYHFDGVRMDAVSRLIYWQGNQNRGENRDAIHFLRNMNRGLKERNQGVILIAEDSTNYPKVTESVDCGGLGFDYKWDLGWMHDTLEFFQSPANERINKYHKLTFSMHYFQNERYLLPFSHDEVVHGKATILQKMSGDYEDKFSQARALYMYMMVHPGKKLNFMGNEIGHFREWDENREQDWDLLKYPAHNSFHHYMMELNKMYMEHNALWLHDYSPDGFYWLDCHSEDKCLYSIMRKGKNESIVGIFNFGNKPQMNYKIKDSALGKVSILIHSDWERFGGKSKEGEMVFEKSGDEISINIAAYSGILIKVE